MRRDAQFLFQCRVTVPPSICQHRLPRNQACCIVYIYTKDDVVGCADKGKPNINEFQINTLNVSHDATRLLHVEYTCKIRTLFV